MAVTAVLGAPAGAINYTFTTDTSADWASVANSTYFYDKADKLVHFKNSTGTVLEIFAAGGSASGVFGISNTSGVYTYYTTLALAMTAAVSGQVIEMFADFTQSTATSIELKDGVNIQGNGHTYTYSVNDTSSALNQTNAGTYNININNITILRTVGTGSVFNQSYVSDGNINFEGSVLKATGGGHCINSAGGFRFYNITAISTTGTGNGIYFWASGIQGTFINCRGINTSSGAGILLGTGGNGNNCYGESNSGNGLSGSGQFRNCVGKSTSGSGIATDGNIYNCSGFSSTGYGIDTTNATQCVSSAGTSASNLGIFVGGAYISKCTGISSSGVGIASGTGSTQVYDCDGFSGSNFGGRFAFIGGNVIGGKFQSNWNNAGGHALDIQNINSVSKVIAVCTNASAYNIFSGVTYNLKMTQNLFIGGQKTWNPLITNSLSTVEDSQGNIGL